MLTGWHGGRLEATCFCEGGLLAHAVTLTSPEKSLTAHRASLRALTGIRFFAATYVVIFHTQVGHRLHDAGHYAAGNFFLSGYLAVPLFFILSGFILAYTYAGQIETRGDHFRFYEARFARIWPTYILSLLSMSVPSLVFPPLAMALCSLFMVQAWLPWAPGYAGAWNYVCWTLSAEAFFYVTFPWIQIYVERRSGRLQIAWIAVMLAICVAINSAARSIGYPETGIFWWIPLPLIHLPEFLTGVGLGNYFLGRFRDVMKKDTERDGRWGVWTYSAAVATLGLLCCPQNRFTSLVVVSFAALVYGLAIETTLLSRLFSTKTLVLGGGISYAMYLMQLPVKAWVLAVGDSLGVTNRNLSIAISGVVLILVSLFLFKAVENPTRRLLRSFFARLQRT